MKWILVCAALVCKFDPVFLQEFRTYNECMAAVFLYLRERDRKLEVYCKQVAPTRYEQARNCYDR